MMEWYNPCVCFDAIDPVLHTRANSTIRVKMVKEHQYQEAVTEDDGEVPVVATEAEEEGVKEEEGIQTDGVEVTEAEEATKPIVPPDGGFGWVVVVASFFVHAIVLGNLYSFGVFYPVYIEAFNESQGAVAWVGSIGAGLMVGLGVFTGSYADRFGNGIVVFVGSLFIGAGYLLGSFATELWQLYLTHGVLAGIGYSLSFISGVSVVGQWFRVRRGLAVGIAVAGSGLGQFAFSLISGNLIATFGWRGCLRILALINTSCLMICSLGVRRLLPLVKRASTGASLEYFLDHNFVVLFIASIFYALGMFMPYTHLPIFAEKHGVSTSDSVFILSIMGIASAVGRIVSGLCADRFGKVLMLQICMYGGGISTLCWMACKTFPSLMVYGIIYGFFAGGIISLMPSVAAELFGIEKLGSVIGLLYTSNATGNLLSAPIGGFLYDAYHNYYPPISVAGGFLLAGAVIVLLVKKDNKAAQTTATALPTDKENQVEDATDTQVDSLQVKHEQQLLAVENEIELV